MNDGIRLLDVARAWWDEYDAAIAHITETMVADDNTIATFDRHAWLVDKLKTLLPPVGSSSVEALVKQWLKPRRQIDAQRVSPYPKTYWDGIDDARQQCARQLEAALKEDKLPHKLVNPMDRECSPCAPDCLACARAALRELMAWKESAMQQLAKTDELRKVLQPHKEYLGWDVNEAAADLIQKLKGARQ